MLISISPYFFHHIFVVVKNFVFYFHHFLQCKWLRVNWTSYCTQMKIRNNQHQFEFIKLHLILASSHIPHLSLPLWPLFHFLPIYTYLTIYSHSKFVRLFFSFSEFSPEVFNPSKTYCTISFTHRPHFILEIVVETLSTTLMRISGREIDSIEEGKQILSIFKKECFSSCKNKYFL